MSCSMNSARALWRRKDGRKGREERTGRKGGRKRRRKRSEQLCKGNTIHCHACLAIAYTHRRTTHCAYTITHGGTTPSSLSSPISPVVDARGLVGVGTDDRHSMVHVAGRAVRDDASCVALDAGRVDADLRGAVPEKKRATLGLKTRTRAHT